MRYLGAHVSAAGGLENALIRAKELDINTIQIHPTPPQRWNAKPIEANKTAEFLKNRKSSGVKKVFFHGIYLINLAAVSKQNFHLSKISLVNYLDLSYRIKADGVIFHVGSLKDMVEKEGYDQVILGVNWILEHTENDSHLVLESAAGAGKIIGDRLEELARIYDGVKDKDRVAFALDTQHMWASGYDWLNNLNGVIDEVESVLGLDKIAAIHLNDSKTELGSHKDRHEALGLGLLGEAGVKSIINHPKLKQIPFILETPALKDAVSSKSEVERLKEWAEE